MEVCTDDYAEPRYDIMDWCVEADLSMDFLIQFLLELVIFGLLFIVMIRYFKWKKSQKTSKEPLNTGKHKEKVWPPP